VGYLHQLPDLTHFIIGDAEGDDVRLFRYLVLPPWLPCPPCRCFRCHRRNSVSRLDLTAVEYPGKDPFLRHYAIAGLVIDGAAGMALLADLGHFQERRSDCKPGPDRQRHQFDAAGRDVLGEIPGRYRQTQGTHFFDAFTGKQAYLAVPVAGMGIAEDAVILLQRYPGHGTFPFSLGLTDTDSRYFSFHHALL